MKKFAGTKPLIQIKQQCAAAGVAFDDFNFRTKGADYVALGVADLLAARPDTSPFVRVGAETLHGWVMFNTFNGTFYGTTPRAKNWQRVGEPRVPAGVEFDSGSTTHEHEPWFQALLSFFYVEKYEPGAEKPKATAVDLTLGTAALLEKA